jgi:hypothetical protein
MSLSDQLRDTGSEVAAAAERDFAPRLNAALASLFTGFYVGPGAMLATDGQRSANFESLIAIVCRGVVYERLSAGWAFSAGNDR